MNNVTSHKIVITEIRENTVAGDFFKVYDHIVAINGKPVSETEVAKKLIREYKANFQAVIERPVTLETQALVKREVDEWQKKINAPKNLEEMPEDVQQIVLNHMKRRKMQPIKQLVSAFSRGSNRPYRTISFAPNHTETEIQSDVPASKLLRKVNK
ncbi:hypothetical protein AB6A40_006737 [Gnathostoma spinigerum]|uniref:PDZ domain-containing protein n=1 Tax=Gnathostoma spinigerum TaxID=75299 RepID=A0ABD6EJF1_9BILA